MCGYLLNFSKLRIKLGLKPLEVPDSSENNGEKSNYHFSLLIKRLKCTEQPTCIVGILVQHN